VTIDRYVLLGLAHVRAPWFSELARWATSASVPVEFVKTVSVEEVRVRLRSGRGFSALLVGDDVTGVDRDLVDLAHESGCAVVVVTSGHTRRDWAELGAAAVLPAGFGRSDLVDVLSQVSRPVTRTDLPLEDPVVGAGPGWRGRLVAVTGAGGAGTSTTAIAIAQGLASDPRYADLLCLADLARHADQGALHDVADVVPGVVELVDAHRSGVPLTQEVRSLTWEVPERGYHLLLGLRRHREWTTMRQRAFDAALDGLRRSFRVVVADIDDDFEGENACGSLDVEERNLMARTSVAAADVVVAVGRPGLKGLRSLLRVVRDLHDHGVDGERIVPLLNGVSRNPRIRAELAAAFGELSGGVVPDVPSPLFVPHRKRVEEALRDGTRLPEPLVAPLRSAIGTRLDRLGDEPFVGASDPEPVAVAVVPGSLGSWSEDDR
jgi:hypothetical protein